MKRNLILFTVAISLSSCGLMPLVTGVPASPATVADKTTLDEQGAIGAELAYQALAQAILTANDAGLLKDATLRARIRAADSRAFAALGAVRDAYRAGNAINYGAALGSARAAILDALSALKGA